MEQSTLNSLRSPDCQIQATHTASILDAQTFLITDAHKTGLGGMLAQGNSIENAKPVAIASRTTNTSEKISAN